MGCAEAAGGSGMGQPRKRGPLGRAGGHRVAGWHLLALSPRSDPEELPRGLRSEESELPLLAGNLCIALITFTLARKGIPDKTRLALVAFSKMVTLNMSKSSEKPGRTRALELDVCIKVSSTY